MRQAHRMKTFADFEINNGRWVICDFVAPTEKARDAFNPDFVIWLNTIQKGRFEDTNKMFEEPKDVNFRITEMNDENHEFIAKEILKNV